MSNQVLQFGKRSDTTVSTFEEIKTPASTDFRDFNFQLQIQHEKHEKPAPTKPVEGPVGPHLFRISTHSTTQDQDIYLHWSPALPQDQRAGPQSKLRADTEQRVEHPHPASSVPLQAWTSQQVAAWLKTRGFEDSIIKKFRMHDISGAILKDLRFKDFPELGIESFGQRHLLWNEIRNLRGGLSIPSTPVDDPCYTPISPNPVSAPLRPTRIYPTNECSNPPSPEGDNAKSPAVERRRGRARRALRPEDDVISPADSASIIAIEQLLPKPHHCSKGENCSKWQKRQRQMAKIAKEFPLQFEQIQEANAPPSEVPFRPASEAVPSVVASSDLLGPGRLPAVRLDEDVLRVIQAQDPQENVRQFLNFQHLDQPNEEPTTPPYEMFPPLSPPRNTQAPHGNLSNLPRLTIPAAPQRHSQDAFSPSRTAIQQTRSPVTAMRTNHSHSAYDFFRLASPASAMDVPVTAIPLGPVERDTSQSVPPDMRFGADPISRSDSRADHRQPFHQRFSPIARPQTTNPIGRSVSRVSNRRQPDFAMAPLEETHLSPIDGKDELTPTANEINHAGWMKKRKTKMLRHEWQENHFRLNGTRLAMHRDAKAMDALEYIDVDQYAVACSTLASNKLNSAFKSLKLSGKKKDADVSGFSFQLVPAAEKKGLLAAATGKTHHFAVKTRDERIDWMRELMLAKALKQKADGCEVNHNGHII